MWIGISTNVMHYTATTEKPSAVGLRWTTQYTSILAMDLTEFKIVISWRNLLDMGQWFVGFRITFLLPANPSSDAEASSASLCPSGVSLGSALYSYLSTVSPNLLGFLFVV